MRRGGRPQKIEAILSSVLRRAGIEEDIKRYEFVLHWEEIVGADIAKRTKPVALKNGLLKVEVTDSAWAQELSFYKEVIIKRLGKFVRNPKAVRDIRFFVQSDPWRRVSAA